MGIHGLTGFIDNNQHLLHRHELHDCSVVLDGNNLYHFLYYACHVQCSFGGDYDIYRKKIISTFESFKDCNIIPYVILDGAYTVDGRKLKTSLSRAAARIRLVDVMANKHRGQALPSLAYETFIQTLTELGVHHATCQFEADNEIAVLSNKLKCPVISNDSDFYIFDLNSGFLPLDYLDFRPLKKLNQDGTHAYNFLHCHKYVVDDFINSFDGLNRSVLPVFASLLGNDFISVSSFSTFYSKVKVPKVVSKKFSLPPRLSKVISVLHWLHTQTNSFEFSDIKDELLSFIKPERKQKVEKLFVSSVNGYSEVENFQGFDLYSYFTKSFEMCELTALSDFKGYNGAPLPEWFIAGVCKGEMTPSILNCVILHRNIILTQVEDLSHTSSFACSLQLRQVLYGILLKDDQPTSSSGTKSTADTSAVVNGDSDEAKLSAEKLQGESETGTETEAVEGSSVEETDIDGVPAHLEISTEHKKSRNDDGEVKEEDFINDDLECEIECCKGETRQSGGGVRLKQVCVEEYTRSIKNLKKCFVEPVYSTGKLPLPGLCELTTMSEGDRKHVLCMACNVDMSFIEQFSDDLQLFMICVILWARNAEPKVTIRHLDTVIIGLILLKCHNAILERENMKTGKEDTCKTNSSHNNKSDVVEKTSVEDQPTVSNVSMLGTHGLKKGSEVDIGEVCAETVLTELKLLRQNLDKYHKKSPVFNSNNFYDPGITHAFAQLQAAMVDAINLDKLLRFPVPNCRPAELLNGTFLYNFQIQLFTRPEPDLFLATMLGRDSSLHKLFQKVSAIVKGYVGESCIQSPVSPVKKGRKRKSKAKVREGASVEPRTQDSGEEDSPLKSVAGFDVTNRFTALCMEDL